MALDRFHSFIILLLVFSGCMSQGPVCNKPYIHVGYDCCLDEDGDSVCDSDRPAAQSPIESATTSSTTTSTTSTSTTLEDYRAGGWRYRTPLTITENAGETLVDYQVELYMTAGDVDWSHIRDDLGDVRFTVQDGDGERPLSYWVEGYSVDEWARIRVKVPLIPAGGSVSLYMYYGMESVVSESSIADTATWHDEFDALDAAKWSMESDSWGITECPRGLGGSCLVHLQSRIGDSPESMKTKRTVTFPSNGWEAHYRWYRGLGDRQWIDPLHMNSRSPVRTRYCDTQDDQCYRAMHWGNNPRYGIKYMTSSGENADVLDTGEYINQGHWYEHVWRFHGPEDGDWLMNDTMRRTGTSDVWGMTADDFKRTDIVGGYIGLSSHEAGNINYWDYIRVFQYIVPEPTVTFHAEKTN